jgi:hypothetical protein
MAQVQSIAGTYRLVRRELPDGTVQSPPQVMGMLTLTNEYRNFSVVWKDDKGKFYSECYVARYTLTESRYSETAEYLIVNDQIGAKGINYDLSARTASSPVTVDGGSIRFALPQPFEKALSIEVEFAAGGMTAKGKDLFVDHWEKVS